MVDSNLPLFMPSSSRVFSKVPFPVNSHLVQGKQLRVEEGGGSAHSIGLGEQPALCDNHLSRADICKPLLSIGT